MNGAADLLRVIVSTAHTNRTRCGGGRNTMYGNVDGRVTGYQREHRRDTAGKNNYCQAIL